jgi:ubiquinone/menaquinone biosynthesis C-methylase UbiE
MGEAATAIRGPAHALLVRAAPLLRLPTSPALAPEVLPDGGGLRCPATGRVFPCREGVLDLLDEEPALKKTQKVLDTPFTAWVYDRLRAAFLPRLLGLPRFAQEVALIQGRLGVRPGDVVLDLACGHGNFTAEWARRVGPTGLVLGLDVSRAMLARAVERVARLRLGNVLLVRGDARQLPLADGVLTRVNCSGGFHQFPELSRALGEVARVSGPGAALTASTFAEGPRDRHAVLKRWLRRFEWHFVRLDWLGEQLAGLGYRDYRWSLPGGWFAYTSALKGEPRPAANRPTG